MVESLNPLFIAKLSLKGSAGRDLEMGQER